MAQPLVIVLTHAANGDRSSAAFTLANASLSAGLEVLVFLMSDGVDLAREHAADLASMRPFAPLGELIDKFVDAGGTLAACGSCVQYRGIQNEQHRRGLRVAGVGLLVEWLQRGAQTVSF